MTGYANKQLFIFATYINVVDLACLLSLIIAENCPWEMTDYAEPHFSVVKDEEKILTVKLTTKVFISTDIFTL